MKERFEIKELHICSFKLQKTGVHPELEKYPQRLCVIDNERGKAIDIKHELEYDYIETMSGLYLINSSIDKIKENKRAAIFPIITYLSMIDEKDLLRAKRIITFLESGKKYADGNTVLSNEEYLKQVQKEEDNDKNKSNKTKKIGKKQK